MGYSNQNKQRKKMKMCAFSLTCLKFVVLMFTFISHERAKTADPMAKFTLEHPTPSESKIICCPCKEKFPRYKFISEKKVNLRLCYLIRFKLHHSITVFVPQITGVPDETGLVILNWSETRNRLYNKINKSWQISYLCQYIITLWSNRYLPSTQSPIGAPIWIYYKK